MFDNCFKYLCCIAIYVIHVILMTCEDQRKDKRKKSVKSRRPASRECEAAREVRVDLQGSDLWKSFHEIGTEMIITKAGR